MHGKVTSRHILPFRGAAPSQPADSNLLWFIWFLDMNDANLHVDWWINFCTAAPENGVFAQECYMSSI